MLCVRLARLSDLENITALAQKCSVGLTSLIADPSILAQKLAWAVASTNLETSSPDRLFWFVLEDTESGQVVGLSGIETAIGLHETHYTYRVDTIVHASAELGVYHQFPTLFLTNDHSGCSELCSLYLDPDYRNSKVGTLLSKARFLFVAQFRALFADKLIAELRGYVDPEGLSPFWEGLGRHFFAMDFGQADYLSAVNNKRFIAELMPRYPFYTQFLPVAAQEVIGEVHPETLPAKRLLESEGFRYEGCIDIFDAGPTLECYVDQIRAVRDSHLAYPLQLQTLEGFPLLVATLEMEQFRSSLLWPDQSGKHPQDIGELMRVLKVDEHDKVRCVTLNPTPVF